jgi:hypothetical protein
MLVMAAPVMTAASVITVPTDRSMPAVMITNVCPSASTPTTAVAIRIPLMLPNRKNCGEAREKKTKITISAPNARRRWMAPLRTRERDRPSRRTEMSIDQRPLRRRFVPDASATPRRPCAGWRRS